MCSPQEEVASTNCLITQYCYGDCGARQCDADSICNDNGLCEEHESCYTCASDCGACTDCNNTDLPCGDDFTPGGSGWD